MIEFTSFASFGAHLEGVRRRLTPAMKATLMDGAMSVLALQREKFGKYQGAFGPFEAWQQLKQATLERRARRKTNPADEPLLESGDLMDSYEIIETSWDGVAIGSELPYAQAQEIGDDHIPGRSTLGAALYEYEQRYGFDLVEMFGGVLLQGRTFRSILRSRSAFRQGFTPGYGGGRTLEIDL